MVSRVRPRCKKRKGQFLNDITCTTDQTREKKRLSTRFISYSCAHPKSAAASSKRNFKSNANALWLLFGK